MKVRAKAPGFHGAWRKVGDVFDVPDDRKASWFEPVEEAEKSASEAPRRRGRPKKSEEPTKGKDDPPEVTET